MQQAWFHECNSCRCTLTHDSSTAIEHDGKDLLEIEHTSNISVVLSVVILWTTQQVIYITDIVLCAKCGCG